MINITLLSLWSNQSNFGINFITNFWTKYVKTKYNFNVEVNLVNVKNNNNIKKYIDQKKVSVILSSLEWDFKVPEYNIPIIYTSSIPNEKYYNNYFYIIPQPYFIFNKLINEYVKLNVKTIATVYYNDQYNYLRCDGAATYLAVPRGIKYVKSFILYEHVNILNIITELKYINPDVILWCDYDSIDRFSLPIMKNLNYIPKSFVLLNIFNQKIFEYISQPLFTYPSLENTGCEISTNIKLFSNWYYNITGLTPPYQANTYFAALQLLENVFYKITQNKHMSVDDPNDILTLLYDVQSSGVFGQIIFDYNNINSNPPSNILQLYPNQNKPFLIKNNISLIYPIPKWSERTYIWKINNNDYIVSANLIATLCTIVLLMLIITIIIHRNEIDIRMLNYAHMVAICVSSIIAIWSLVYIWQADMNIIQCKAYLWCVHLPISFVIQMMNMKAYRLSVYLYQENKHRFKKLNHNRMLLLTFMWICLTLLFITIATVLDPPILVTIKVDPWRPIYDLHYCDNGMLTNILLYTLVGGHCLFSVICIINIRNGANDFYDGVVMKEAFAILWIFITLSYIMQSLSLSISLLYLIRVSFLSIGLTIFCVRILVSRCYRHIVPKIVELLIIRLCNKVGKIIPWLDNTYNIQWSTAVLDLGGESESPVFDNSTNILSESLDDMYEVLHDPVRSKLFIRFAEQALYLKHVDFILSIIRYTEYSNDYLVNASISVNNKIRNDAINYYALYIKEGSIRELPLEPNTRNYIWNHLQEWDENVPIINFTAADRALDYEHMNIFKKAFDETSIILYQNLWYKFRAYEIEHSMS
jgi:hypothetical protein